MKKWLLSRQLLLIVSAVLTAVGLLGLLLRGIAWCWLLAYAIPAGVASVGIIGGADGPTAIFLTSSTGLRWYFFLILTIFGIVGLMGCRKNRKRDN